MNLGSQLTPPVRLLFSFGVSFGVTNINESEENVCVADVVILKRKPGSVETLRV